MKNENRLEARVKRNRMPKYAEDIKTKRNARNSRRFFGQRTLFILPNFWSPRVLALGRTLNFFEFERSQQFQTLSNAHVSSNYSIKRRTHEWLVQLGSWRIFRKQRAFELLNHEPSSKFKKRYRKSRTENSRINGSNVLNVWVSQDQNNRVRVEKFNLFGVPSPGK